MRNSSTPEQGTMPRMQALETIAADTARIKAAAEQRSQELIEMRVQEAANNLRRLFGYASINDIVDDQQTDSELIELKGTVLAEVDKDSRVYDFTRAMVA